MSKTKLKAPVLKTTISLQDIPANSERNKKWQACLEMVKKAKRIRLNDTLISLAVSLARHRDYGERIKKRFSQRDLVGKTIEEYVIVGNPRPVHTSRESPNPDFFEVQVFNDGTFLLANSWRDEEYKHTDFYYHDGKILHYSNNLFG
jgi:hypothetical protein